jgi:hypothetical protein
MLHREDEIAMPRASDALIAMVSRHIAESDIRISAQMERIERLKQIGAGTTEAEEFLKLFEVSMGGRQGLLRKLTYCHEPAITNL